MSGSLTCCTVNQTRSPSRGWLPTAYRNPAILCVCPHIKNFDLLPRLCVPLWEGEKLCGHIWLIDSPAISEADLEIITSYRRPIIDLMAARDETFLRRVAEMREIARDVTLGLDGSLAHAVDNNFLPRNGVIRIHQLTIREAAELAVTTDAPERLMLELLRFRRRRPFLVTDNHDGLTIVERSDDVAASQSLFDALQAASSRRRRSNCFTWNIDNQ